ncbi:alcohol dehydrogenase [Lachnospiraceae bacterium KM106-2]|nr:alcohol dehydrogenase [Lachnospiraceae bacterium KM106-2]
MKEALMLAPGEIVIQDEEIPEITKLEVLVRVIQFAICGTDKQIFTGEKRNVNYPHVPCHEAIGIVEKVGSCVEDVKLGDKVLLNPQVTCYHCKYCLAGYNNRCKNIKIHGICIPGFAREYVAIDHHQVIKIPAVLSNDHAVMIEPIAVANEMIKQAGILEEKDLLILGGGTIGNITAQLAKLFGARNVVISEPNKLRREIAEECGLVAINPKTKDFEKQMTEVFHNVEPEMIIDCAGYEGALMDAINYIMIGGKILVIGEHTIDEKVDVERIQKKFLSIIGCRTYQNQDLIQVIDLLLKGYLRIKPLITDHVPFSYIDRAFKDVIKAYSKQLKVIITM